MPRERSQPGTEALPGLLGSTRRSCDHVQYQLQISALSQVQQLLSVVSGDSQCGHWIYPGQPGNDDGHDWPIWVDDDDDKDDDDDDDSFYVPC